MSLMQVRYSPESADLIARVLENATPGTLSAAEQAKAKELAAYLRYRATRLWGGDYTNSGAAAVNLTGDDDQAPDVVTPAADDR